MGVRFLSGTAFFHYKIDKQEKERKKVMGMARKPKSQGNEFLNKLKEDKMFAGIVFGGAAVILVIVIILISVLIKGGKDEKPEKIAAANEQQTEETSEPQDGGQTETVEATDTVNVRKSDSENADKLGKLEIGTRVTRFEARENGWSRVEYNGGEGFVKSEYLKVVSAETASENTDNSASEPASSEGVSTSGTIGIKETVNVRESAGEDAKKIGVAYENEHYKLIMKQADGWSKIDFNGKIGFVKSEYVTFE